jgi:hypothetical protein
MLMTPLFVYYYRYVQYVDYRGDVLSHKNSRNILDLWNVEGKHIDKKNVLNSYFITYLL